MLKKLFKNHSSVRYVLSSAASWLVDNGLYFILLHFVLSTSAMTEVMVSTLAQVTARVISSFFNFNCNNFFVFHGENKYSKALARYYCVCIPQTVISVILLDVVIKNMTTHNDLLQTALKILIEGILFALSYLIQNKWVFGKNKNKA